jgi:hypothetical protein
MNKANSGDTIPNSPPVLVLASSWIDHAQPKRHLFNKTFHPQRPACTLMFTHNFKLRLLSTRQLFTPVINTIKHWSYLY